MTELNSLMQPLKFEPILKQIRWGGRKLGTVLQKPIGTAADYAESWEIADQPSGQSVVAAGIHRGKTLSELMVSNGNELLGADAQSKRFPLLIKFLDANDWLSLQVHPNDNQALRYDRNENGKTEAWVILHAEPDSLLCSGLKSGVTRSDFEAHLKAGTVEETLHMIPARVGDCVFVPAQTVHALGPGILLAEIQQQSNLTFRLHDWGRMGSDGHPRPIHVKESLECIDFDRGPVNPVQPAVSSRGPNKSESLVQCEYFQITRHTTRSPHLLQLKNRFRIMMLLSGAAELQTESTTMSLIDGETVLVPACIESTTLSPVRESVWLEIGLP